MSIVRRKAGAYEAPPAPEIRVDASGVSPGRTLARVLARLAEAS
jgi:hypothetical protein